MGDDHFYQGPTIWLSAQPNQAEQLLTDIFNKEISTGTVVVYLRKSKKTKLPFHGGTLANDVFSQANRNCRQPGIHTFLVYNVGGEGESEYVFY